MQNHWQKNHSIPSTKIERDELAARTRFVDSLIASGLSYSVSMIVFAAADSWRKASALQAAAIARSAGESE